LKNRLTIQNDLLVIVQNSKSDVFFRMDIVGFLTPKNAEKAYSFIMEDSKNKLSKVDIQQVKTLFNEIKKTWT
jgi:hypothetical protein